jgi:hypothetical protein
MAVLRLGALLVLLTGLVFMPATASGDWKSVPANLCTWDSSVRPEYFIYGSVDSNTASQQTLRCPLLRDSAGTTKPSTVRVQVTNYDVYDPIGCRLAVLDGDSSYSSWTSYVYANDYADPETLYLTVPSAGLAEGAYTITCTWSDSSTKVHSYAWNE